MLTAGATTRVPLAKSVSGMYVHDVSIVCRCCPEVANTPRTNRKRGRNVMAEGVMVVSCVRHWGQGALMFADVCRQNCGGGVYEAGKGTCQDRKFTSESWLIESLGCDRSASSV